MITLTCIQCKYGDFESAMFFLIQFSSHTPWCTLTVIHDVMKNKQTERDSIRFCSIEMKNRTEKRSAWGYILSLPHIHVNLPHASKSKSAPLARECYITNKKFQIGREICMELTRWTSFKWLILQKPQD